MSRVILITGCSTGIGRATALAFARCGDRVYATMRAPERGAELALLVADQGLNVEIAQLDVTDDASVRAAVDAIASSDGRIDVVVNNAGIGPFGPIERTSDDHWIETFNTNLMGAVRVTRAVLPLMRAHGTGSIVNISSVAGRMAPLPTQAAYAASKHALCALTDSINAECAPFGIKAYCIEPGFFATAIMDKDTVPRLDANDPYKPMADGIEKFFRTSVAAAPAPDAVAGLILEAADGRLHGEVHHPIGVQGLKSTQTAARIAPSG